MARKMAALLLQQTVGENMDESTNKVEQKRPDSEECILCDFIKQVNGEINQNSAGEERILENDKISVLATGLCQLSNRGYMKVNGSGPSSGLYLG